jgi:hypothetical protein
MTIVLLSFPFFRHVAYECFLRAHQGLAAFVFYATWHHLAENQRLPRLWITCLSDLLR